MKLFYKKNLQKVFSLLVFVLLLQSNSWGQNQFFAGDGSLFTASKWAPTCGGSYTSAFTASNIANFCVVNGTGTGGSFTVGGISATENFTLTAITGTISNAANGVITIDVASGKTLDFSTQSFTSSASAGYIKNNSGVLALAGNTYGGGFTLNAGTLIARGTSAMGGNATPGPLTINGGTIAANATRTFAGKYSGITIGGDFTLGATTGLAATAANLTFNATMALGGVARAITIGGTGTYFLNGVISNGSLNVASTAAGTISLGGVNTYIGGTTITGGTLQLGAAGVLADAGTITLNGGTLKTGATTGFSETVSTLALTANSTITLGTGVHTLTFAASNGIGWTGSTMLTINGWAGGYNGTSGTAGEIFVGASAAGLTAGQLAQIQFFDGTSNFPATILASGEVVPITNPTISVSPTTLTGFTYLVGSGPSTEQTFTCSGSGLTANIILTPPADYEISLSSGAGFGGFLTLTQVGGIVASTTIYTRLKAGLTAGTYNSENITATSTGATTQNVTCSGTVTAGSALSDIITFNGESVTISSLINTASPLTSATGVQVWQFKVRDGGATLSDADILATILNAFTISEPAGNSVSNWATAIKTIELFDGATNVGIGTVTTAPNQIAFSGLSLSVADNTEKTYSLRLSLNCGIGSANADGNDFGFEISNENVTFSPTGSGKFAFAVANTINGKNLISVVATQLQFFQQPIIAGINNVMSPDVIVKATDACGNTDLDFAGNISITSTGTLTGTPVTAAAVSGAATFNSLIHSVLGTNHTLTAASGGFTSVVSNLFDIVNATTFGAGDIAIVGMCVRMDGCAGSTTIGEDEISFVSFEDILPGTTIDLTDNGFERKICGSNTWGNTEGVIRITRTTSTVPKGTVVTLRILEQSIFTPLQPDANWMVSYPNSGYGTFDMNSTDEQIYIMQGGTWNKGTSNTHDATYTGGTLMFAINTYTVWSCNGNLTTRGDLPLPLKCFSILPGIASKNIKYTGAVTAATQKDWIDRLNSPGNWSGTATCAAYIAGGLDYGSTSQIYTISAGGFSAGVWTGASTIDWFDCNNWQNYKVPDSLVNVSIDNVANDPIIGASPVLYPAGAICNDLLITNTSGSGILTLNNALSYFSIKGNITNNGIITGSNGLTELRSINAQVLSGSGATQFYNLRFNNTNASSVSLSQDITVSNNLTFTNGMLSTGANKLIITNTVVPTIFGFTSSKFINGNLRHSIANNTSTYVFPIGDGMASTNYKRFDLINNSLATTSYITGSVANVPQGTPSADIDANLGTSAMQWSMQLTNVLNSAIWTLIPDAQPTAGSYGVNLYVQNVANLSAADDDMFCPVKRADASVTYADWSTYSSTPTAIPNNGLAGRIYNGGAGYAQRTGYQQFSKHAIAKAPVILPIELLSFTANYNGKNVDLKWVTASELNNDYFTIERSADAANFEQINTIEGAGTSTHTIFYSTVDEAPLSGISYYRLKQTDFDGKLAYSNIVSVEIQNNNDFQILNIFNSVENGTLNVTVNCGNNCFLNFELYDMTGKKVYSSIQNFVGNNKIISIPTPRLSQGLYLLKVYNGEKMISMKLKL